MVKKIFKTMLIRILKLASNDNHTYHTLVAYHDISYANLKDGNSQGGCAMSLTDNTTKYMLLIASESNSIKRAVKGTLVVSQSCCQSCTFLYR